MKEPEFLRARRPEHKQQRREAILAAARELALRSGVRTVSLRAVAAAAGLAKSNVVRYFGTREEIYLELAAEEWQGWRDAATERLRTAGGPGDVVDALAETLEARPLMCDLLGYISASLEHNVSLEAARAFKMVLLDVGADLGAQVARATGLTDGEGLELVGTATGLAAFLYPMAHPSPVLAELYAQEPRIAAARPPFLPTLKRALTAFLAGLPTLR
ncbi:TetR/AcrR family transcriptional regulator [Nonomuraea basaltis]|uniref:TetR/AcrR family transcriptional regulator n=1 Tax=Nonomuraea basaltis TaxID=2495887 RepID=UPI00110C62D1|nr:TetR family transcriptional regulator [Nonomuraea basaltis]TMR91707.1 TetR/AcrR family transcriptional regulator [Nonomuraea basaltis]